MNALCFRNMQVYTHLKALTGGLVRVIRATDRLTSSYRAILSSWTMSLCVERNGGLWNFGTPANSVRQCNRTHSFIIWAWTSDVTYVSSMTFDFHEEYKTLQLCQKTYLNNIWSQQGTALPFPEANSLNCSWKLTK